MDAPTPLLLPGFILLLIGGGCLFCCWCLCGSGAVGRVMDDCGAPATSAMWPAVLHGGRPRNEAAGQLTAFDPGYYAGAAAEAK